MKTLQEIENSGKEMLLPADIADYLGCDPQSIRLQARADAAALGFPVIVVGNRCLFPRAGFVRFCKAYNITGENNAQERA